MNTNVSYKITSSILDNVYRNHQARLNDSMVRVSSGKRIMTPADGARDYFHASWLKADLTGLDGIKSQIVYGQGLVKIADQVGSRIWDDLNQMAVLTKQYYNTDDTSIQELQQVEFNAIKSRTVDAVNQAYYDGRKLVADGSGTPILQIVIDPRNVSSTFDIEYGSAETVDASGLTLGATDYATESAALQTQIGKAGNYLARTNAYGEAIDVYYTLTNNKIVAYQKGVENTENADTGAEMMKYTKESILQEMTVSMMAQGNMLRNSVLSLLQTGR